MSLKVETITGGWLGMRIDLHGQPRFPKLQTPQKETSVHQKSQCFCKLYPQVGVVLLVPPVYKHPY